jgi:hypothetical protein
VPICWTEKHRNEDSDTKGRQADTAQAAEPAAESAISSAVSEPVSQAGLLTYAVDVPSSRQGSAERPSTPDGLSLAAHSRHSEQLQLQQPGQTGSSSPAAEDCGPDSESMPIIPLKQEADSDTDLERGGDSSPQQQRRRQSVWYRSWEVCQPALCHAVYSWRNNASDQLSRICPAGAIHCAGLRCNRTAEHILERGESCVSQLPMVLYVWSAQPSMSGVGDD